MSKIVFLAGEGEYESDRTMRPVAEDLHREIGADIVYRTPDVLPDMPLFPSSSFGDLDDLADADLLVIYTRFRILPDEEMRRIVEFCERGGSVLGLRTSTHAFHYPADSPWSAWNDQFGRDVLGSPWVSHHGHTSTTDVTWFSDQGHPILEGIPGGFTRHRGYTATTCSRIASRSYGERRSLRRASRRPLHSPGCANAVSSAWSTRIWASSRTSSWTRCESFSLTRHGGASTNDRPQAASIPASSLLPFY